MVTQVFKLESYTPYTIHYYYITLHTTYLGDSVEHVIHHGIVSVGGVLSGPEAQVQRARNVVACDALYYCSC